MTLTITRLLETEEAEAGEAGGWTVRLQLAELPDQHRAMLDYLVERVTNR